MTERVISIKMPASLVQELKQLTKQHHYIDLSEQVRSIVRQKSLQYMTGPADLQQLRESIEQQIKANTTQLKKEQILKELARLLEEGS